MKTLKKTLFLITLSFVLVSFSQCASSMKLQDTTTIKFGKAYSQSWIAGVQGGGSGTNIFIPVISKPENITLDSIYYKHRKAPLNTVNNNLYVGRFKSAINNKRDIVMSNEPYAEYGNGAPKATEKTPFELNENECIIRYTENNTSKYYKLSGILKKESQYYPQAPPKN